MDSSTGRYMFLIQNKIQHKTPMIVKTVFLFGKHGNSDVTSLKAYAVTFINILQLET